MVSSENFAKIAKICRYKKDVETSLNIFLIFAFAAVYPLIHMGNGFLFRELEISSHVSLVYMPAFLRLFHVLVLGPIKGSLATILGGFLLMNQIGEASHLVIMNNLCSAAGPLMALALFNLHFKRPVGLSSLKDLFVLTLLYCLANALVHHVMWSIFDTSQLKTPFQFWTMVAGDLFGCLIGVGLMKLAIDRFGLPNSA